MKNQQFSADWNEYLTGFVVTEILSGKEVNFQFDYKHSYTSFQLSSAVDGDMTAEGVSEDTLEQMQQWLQKQSFAKKATRDYTRVMNDADARNSFLDLLAEGNGVSESELSHIAKKIKE